MVIYKYDLTAGSIGTILTTRKGCVCFRVIVFGCKDVSPSVKGVEHSAQELTDAFLKQDDGQRTNDKTNTVTPHLKRAKSLKIINPFKTTGVTGGTAAHAFDYYGSL